MVEVEYANPGEGQVQFSPSGQCVLLSVFPALCDINLHIRHCGGSCSRAFSQTQVTGAQTDKEMEANSSV